MTSLFALYGTGREIKVVLFKLVSPLLKDNSFSLSEKVEDAAKMETELPTPADPAAEAPAAPAPEGMTTLTRTREY